MRADQMMIKCSHTEGRNPRFLACMEHVAAMRLLLCLYFLQPEIYRLCLINVFLGWKSLAVFCGWLFTVQSMKSTGKKCINVLYLAGKNEWRWQVYLYYKLIHQRSQLAWTLNYVVAGKGAQVGCKGRKNFIFFKSYFIPFLFNLCFYYLDNYNS